MLQRPKRGSFDWLPLHNPGPEHQPAPATHVCYDSAFKGVEVAIAYEGVEVVDDFEMRQQAIQISETKRLADLRRDVGGEAGRELAKPFFENIDTADGLAEWKKLSSEILSKLVVGVRGVDPVVEREDVLSFLTESLTLKERLRLMTICLAAQGPSRRQFFRAAIGGLEKAGRLPGAQSPKRGRGPARRSSAEARRAVEAMGQTG